MTLSGVIIANSPDIGDFDLAKLTQGFDIIVALDGAANRVARSIRIDVICGDFDSIDEVKVRKEHGDARYLHFEDQNANDLEKAILFLLQDGVSEIVLLHGWTGRVDQMFATLSTVLRYHTEIPISVRSDREEVWVLSEKVGEQRISCVDGDGFGILPLSPEIRITASGLEWELHDEVVVAGSRGVSNVCRGKEVTIRVSSGIAAVVRELKGQSPTARN